MIAEILKAHGAIGKENAMKVKQLTDIVALPTRQIIAAVFRERKDGVLICSDTYHGYYLPATVDEVRAFIKTQERRIVSHAVSIHAAREYIKTMTTSGQRGAYGEKK